MEFQEFYDRYARSVVKGIPECNATILYRKNVEKIFELAGGTRISDKAAKDIERVVLELVIVGQNLALTSIVKMEATAREAEYASLRRIGVGC